MKILVTGGAGYKGVKLSKALLDQKHAVTVLDNFMYGYEPVFNLVPYKNCKIISKDIRVLTARDFKDYDIVYHLAAISGYPACEANPHAAQIINSEATKQLAKHLASDQLLVYASTTSVYGDYGIKVDESVKPKAGTLYAATKYEGEKAVMKRRNSIAFRFATLFGVSPRMRNDLMVHDFVHRALTERSLVLFDADSVRTFLHLDDAIGAYLMAPKLFRKMRGNIYNIGSNKLNYSKRDLANHIKKYVSFDIIESVLEDRDRRDFVISYDRIEKLGFKAKKSMGEGILELVKLYTFYKPHQDFRTI